MNLIPLLEICLSSLVHPAVLSTLSSHLGSLRASQKHRVVLLPQILTLRASLSTSEGDVDADTLLWPLRLSTQC